MLADLDLFSLTAFLAIAEEGSFAKAARRLFVSEPAVSVRIRSLEERLGFTLFERSNRGVRLTQAGELLAEGVGATLERLEEVVRQAQDAAKSHLQHLGLWCTPDTLSRIVPSLITNLAQVHPDVELAVRVNRPEEVLANLARGRLDCALVPSVHQPHRGHFASSPLIRDVVGLVFAPTHLLAARQVVGLDDLRPYPLLCFDRMGAFRPRLEQALRRARLELSPLSIESVGGIKALVRQQPAIAFFPQLAVLEDVRQGVLAFRPIEVGDGQWFSQVTWFCTAERHSLMPVLKAISDLLCVAAEPFQTELDQALERSRQKAHWGAPK